MKLPKYMYVYVYVFVKNVQLINMIIGGISSNTTVTHTHTQVAFHNRFRNFILFRLVKHHSRDTESSVYNLTQENQHDAEMFNDIACARYHSIENKMCSSCGKQTRKKAVDSVYALTETVLSTHKWQ